MNKEYFLERSEMMYELGFKLIVLSDKQIIFRKSTFINERNVIISYVNLITMELWLKDHLFLSDICFQKKYDIPKSVLESKDIFSDWLIGILKSVAKDIETTDNNQESKQEEFQLFQEQLDRRMKNIANTAN